MALILAYHGCSRETARLLVGGSPFLPSARDYDWLGKGIYFWEDDPARAYQWACDPYRKYQEPSLVGTLIRKGHCLDLTTQTGIEAVRIAYQQFIQTAAKTGRPVPENRDLDGTAKGDRVLRRLDCAVINHLFELIEDAHQSDPGVKLPVTVRALFPEGSEIYSGSGFLEKTHVQLCVRDPRQILGVFRLPEWQREELELPVLY